MKTITLTEVATAAELNQLKGVVNNNAGCLKKLCFMMAGYIISDYFLGYKPMRNEIEALRKRIDILERNNKEEAEFFEE